MTQDPLERAREELQREWRMRAALEQLYEVVGTDGVVTLTGGVRGWAEILGCSLGWPKKLLGELERRRFVQGVEFYPGEGGQVAEVHLIPRRVGSAPSRSVIDQAPTPKPPPAETPIAGPHQDAIREKADSITDRSPHTPNKVLNHDSMCGGGGGENPQPDNVLEERHRPAYQALLDLGVGRDEALILAPEATLGQIGYLVASGRREPADDLPAWVVAGIRAGRRPPQRLAPKVATHQREKSAAPAPSAPAGPSAPGSQQPEPPPERSAPPEVRAPVPASPFWREWQGALTALHGIVPEQEINAWLRQLRLIRLDAGEAELVAANAMLRDGAQRLAKAIGKALGDHLGRPRLAVRIVVAGEQCIAAATAAD